MSFRLGARSLRVVPNVSLRRCAFQIRWHNSQQQLDAVMSSPVSKAKQPSIHAFFAGASVKKPAASVQGGAGKVEKAKTAQEQLKTEKKRSAPGGEADDGKNTLQEAPSPELKRVKRKQEDSKPKESTHGLEDSDDEEDVPIVKQFRDKKKTAKEDENDDPAAVKDKDWKAEESDSEEDEEDNEDDNVDVDEADACEEAEDSEEDAEGEGDQPSKSKAKKTKSASKKSINDALKRPKTEKGKVDGVGAGAVAAAALHTDFDVEALIKDSKWREGEPVPYAFLVAAFNEIAPQSKRLAIIATLTNTFRCAIRLTPADLLPMVYLCTSRVAPAYSGKELGIGDAILIKSVAQASGRQEAQVKKEYNELGDLGEVACNSKGKQRTMFAQKPLTVRGVFKQLTEIASIEGHKSQDQKKSLIMKLLSAAKDAEPGFIVRSMQGKLRIGLAEQSVLVALAQAVTLERLAKDDSKKLKGEALANILESANNSVRTAYGQCPSYDMLIPALLEHGVDNLSDHVHFAPGIPIKAMLARPTNGVTEVLDKFSGCEFTCEYKYDGERAQVHVQEDGTVHVYSRNLENTTSKYPDIIARMPQAMAPGVKSVVLDGEVQAWDTEKKVFLPFQVLTTRKRKDVAEDQIKVQVVLYCFDCLYLDGQVLLKKSLRERREAMHKAIIPQEGKVQFATCKTSKDVEELQAFLDESVAASTEGLIVKTLADPYEPSKRSLNWLKLKKDYLEGCGDTFDVTVIGALHGKGKRTGGYGSFLLAIYDTEAEEFQTISKIGTGFSEELIKELSDQLKDLVIPKAPPYYRVTDKLVPDVWIEAKVVWEVKAADLSVSPVYTAGIGKVDSSKGISIRFPRLVRVRDDKTSEETTSPDQVADMYRNQAVINTSAKTGVDDDFW